MKCLLFEFLMKRIDISAGLVYNYGAMCLRVYTLRSLKLKVIKKSFYLLLGGKQMDRLDYRDTLRCTHAKRIHYKHTQSV